jgi:L-cysteate sulfo-lyase
MEDDPMATLMNDNATTRLRSVLSRQPRVRLVASPSPLEDATQLRNALGGPRACPRILIKRDDLIGFGAGGTKVRNMECTAVTLLDANATDVITCGNTESNHVRICAALAARLGMRAHIILAGSRARAEASVNRQIAVLFGATITLLETDVIDPLTSADAMHAEAVRIAQEITRAGGTPAIVPVGGSTAEGMTGAATVIEELIDQHDAATIDALYVATGSHTTHVGLQLGARLAGLSMRIVAVAAIARTTARTGAFADKARRAAMLFDVPEADVLTVDADESELGSAYEEPTARAGEALDLLARTEGILIDRIYTARAAARMICDIRAQKYQPDATIVLLHTGGTPSLFSTHDVMASARPSLAAKKPDQSQA